MNKLSKLGVSALCGSLAAISSAHAGDLSATGSAQVTWMSKEDAVTGNPIGMNSGFGLNGSGELDNGWSVAFTVAHTDAGAYSNANITLGIPGLGDVRLDQGTTGTGLQRMDDLTPSAWEEADGAGQSIGKTGISGITGGANIQIENFEMQPDGLAIVVAFTKDSDSATNIGEKNSGGVSGIEGAGYDLSFTATEGLHGMAGLTVYGGLSQVDQYQNANTVNGDKEETVLGVKYAAGGFTVGYQQNEQDTGLTAATSYDTTMYSVVFAVNDDLSVSYGHVESDKQGDSDVAEAQSLQAAYTMGGATFAIAEVSADNIAYDSTDNKDTTVLSLSLAF